MAVKIPNGKPVCSRVDGRLKVSGHAHYADDITLPDMLYAAVLRSPHPHARILSINCDEARRLRGVQVIVTPSDLSYARYGGSVRDIPVLADERVLFVGDRVAAVVADSPEVAEKAVALIDVEYEPLLAVFDPEDALQATAPLLHDAPWDYKGAVTDLSDHPNLQSRLILENGQSTDETLAQSPHVFQGTFRTGVQHQGYLEKHVCVASVEGDVVHIWAPHKSPYRLQRQTAEWLGVDPSLVHIHPVFIGGDFGGKGSQMEVPLTVALARMTSRPVKLKMSYAEELIAGDPRHSSTVTVRLGIDEGGRISAMEVHALLNGGAYAGYKPVAHANLNGVRDAGSAYRIPSTRITSTIAYTNTVPRGHARAPGSTQVHFAVESVIDIAARELGMDPLAFRERNMLTTGQPDPLGTGYLEVRSRETLQVAQAALDAIVPRPLPGPEWVRGTGFAFYQRPSHGGVTEIGLEATAEGNLIVHVPFPDQGAGQWTIGRNIMAKVLRVSEEAVTIRQAELHELETDTGAAGSRVTVTASEAFYRAGMKLLEELHHGYGLPATHTERQLRSAIARYADVHRGKWLRMRHDARHIDPVCSYNVTVVVARVDMGTGQVVVEDIVAAFDVAEVINPISHRLQLEGGVVFGFGMALLEDVEIQDGQVTRTSLGDYKLPSQEDIPSIHICLAEGGRGIGSANVKSVGELANVAIPSAIANAVADATGIRVKRLPIRAETMYFAIRDKEGAP